MIAKSCLSRGWQLKLAGNVAILGTLSVGVSKSLNAQIVPDNTLGAERSVVTPNVNIRGIPSNQIDGGATRGANLFHSFSDFNIGAGRGVYFANPAGIENILTRVTGNNSSNIFGRLGVLGGANLFLLNPNGIVFGQNASLDIQGSFLATTANRIQLGDRGYFSATEPQTSRLLSVSPGALFFNAVANQPTSIINQGNLSTPKNLTLSAGNLDLQGQLEALEDLTLQAQDTVKVRDSVRTPFLAQTGANLTIIGNGGIDILALNHPTQTPFVSGGNLSLISDGVISGDARFSSGGSFSIKSVSGGLANFVSLYDPIISSNGDVDVAANYTGASLLVEATGNIRFGGDINITGPDTSGLPAGPDTATLSTSSALIMRSGQSALAYGGVNSGVVPAYSNGTVPAGITIGGNVILQPFNGVGGIVNLSAASGDVSTQLISINGKQTFNFDNNTTGGAISISAKDGSITTGNLYSLSSSISGNAGNGGVITLSAANDIFINGDLGSASFSVEGNADQGGAITLSAANDIFINGDLDSSSYSRSGTAGQGGAITLSAANDIFIKGNLYSYSLSFEGNAAQGGAITLTAANDINLTDGYLDSSSYSLDGNADQGGAITLTAANDINPTGFLSSFSYSEFGTAGQGGAISLISISGDILGIPFIPLGDTEFRSPILGSFSISERGTAGNGGKVTLEAKNNISNLDILTLSSSSQSGTVQITGLSDLSLTNTNILTSKQVSVTIPNIVTPVVSLMVTLDVGGKGQSGNVAITSSGNLTFNNSRIESDTKGSDNAGNVTINSPNLVTFNDSSIKSNTNSTGAAGRINIEAGQGITLIGSNSELSTIFAGTTNSGVAGDITLTTPQLSLQNGARITSDTSSTSGAGAITLQSHPNTENLKINLTPGTSISASTSDQGTGGNIEIKAPNAITIQGQGTITTETTGSGAAGELRIDTKHLTIADGATISASTSSPKPEGRGGSIIINAKDSFNLNNQASLRAQSTGAAPGGNITISTGELTANNGSVATSSEQSSGGDIKITASNIRLFGNSDITTTVNSGTGKGGDITLTAGSIVAFSDSDILAYAPTGTGGNITLKTPAFFGENYRPATPGTDPRTLEGNNRVDINATGVVSGVITTPDVSFIQNSLAQLPNNQINTDQLLANSCIVRRNQPTQGRFVVTGTGGLPERPGDLQMSSFPTVDVETLPSDSTPSTTLPNRPWQKGDPIVEPQGVYRLPNGKLVLSRECP